MKKPLSDLTAMEFIEHCGALGMRYSDIAAQLGKSPSIISRYVNGAQRVPQDVAMALRRLIDAKAADLLARGTQIDVQNKVSSLIKHNNTKRLRPHQRHATLGRLMGRQGYQDTRTYPLYRMSAERVALYAEALAAWFERIRVMAREHTDEARQRDYHLEIADIKALAASVPRQAPYDVCITHAEWKVVSRALAHLSKTAPEKAKRSAADSLRHHWLRYKSSGYVSHRKYPRSLAVAPVAPVPAIAAPRPQPVESIDVDALLECALPEPLPEEPEIIEEPEEQT